MSRLVLSLFCVFALTGCDNDGESTLLDWKDSASGIRFEVFKKPTIAKINNYFRVGDQETLIDNDVSFSNPRFLKIDGWLLVLNETDVWAGYNYGSKRLYGEYDWDELPFTSYSSGGTVVAEERLHSKGKSSSPLGWQRRNQASEQDAGDQAPAAVE